MKKYQFTIDARSSLDQMATQFMLYASAVFDECFPEQWEAAMRTLSDRIGQQVRSTSVEGLPGLRVIDGGA